MKTIVSGAAVVGVAALLVAAPGYAAKPSSIKSPPKLTATVGPKGLLTLKTGSGKPIGILKPGWYTVLVRDLGTDRNFHIMGPGVNRFTSVKFRGSALWGLKLSTGTYVYSSDPQQTSMRRAFKVS